MMRRTSLCSSYVKPPRGYLEELPVMVRIPSRYSSSRIRTPDDTAFSSAYSNHSGFRLNSVRKPSWSRNKKWFKETYLGNKEKVTGSSSSRTSTLHEEVNCATTSHRHFSDEGALLELEKYPANEIRDAVQKEYTQRRKLLR